MEILRVSATETLDKNTASLCFHFQTCPRNRLYLPLGKDDRLKTVLASHFCKLHFILTDVMLDPVGC